jgi:hypothetical protein
MTNNELILKIVELGKEKVRPIFKNKQYDVLKKISFGTELTETEKRYLRGNIKKKLDLLNVINSEQYNPRVKDYSDFLKILGLYYITGLEALKNNGFGWDLKINIIEVINTKLNGEIEFSNKILKFIKAKSIKKAGFILNKSNNLKYATNEQIINDTKLTKNLLVKKKWMNHYLRYKSEFAKLESEKI